MCRAQSEGGRRCPGSGASRAVAAGADWDEGQRESYEGTPWQGYDEYIQRSAELDRRIAAGEKIDDIMREDQLRRGRERIAQIAREGW